MTNHELSPIQAHLDGLLSEYGEVTWIRPEEYFGDVKFEEIPWIPTYACRTNSGHVWAIEILRGTWDVEPLVQSMVATRELDNDLQLMIVAPEESDPGDLVEPCAHNQINLIAYLDGAYEFIKLTRVLLPESFTNAPCRIPPALVNQLAELTLLPSFSGAITKFAENHSDYLQKGLLNDQTEKNLLKDTVADIINSDNRLVTTFELLDLLWAFERLRSGGRDHFFHTFHNFFLGLVVIDGARDLLELHSRECFPHGEEISPEYTWLLTALYHDAGNAVSRRHEFLFGIEETIGDQESAELAQIWDTPEFRRHREQLVSIFNHLQQEEISESWVPEVFGSANSDPFDNALKAGFLVPRGHSVASSLQLLTRFRKIAATLDQKHKNYLARHVYMAALSMIFHDWRVRGEIRKLGVPSIRSSRFPYACLLMFIDSIQDDRREQTIPDAPMDILEGLEIDGKTIRARIDLKTLGENVDREEVINYLGDKQIECRSIQEFIEPDGFEFEYPDEFVGA